MRQSGRITAVLGVAIVATAASGVAVAATKAPSIAKACVLPSGALRLPTTSGGCAKGQSSLTLGTQGARGPQGPPGPAGKAIPVNLNQTVVEGTSTTPINHYLAQAGPVSVLASCAPAATAGAVTLRLSITGEADALTYTASSISTDTGAAPITTVTHGVDPALATSVVDVDTTSGALSDVVTLVISSDDGTEVTATVDDELNAVTAPACTVDGTVSAS